MPWFKSLMYRKCQLKHLVPRKCQEMSNRSSFGQMFSQQINAQTIKRLEVGMGLFFGGKHWSKGRVPWKLIRVWFEVKNKEPKWFCAPPPTPHKWWWNAFVNLSWCPHPELITLPTLHTWHFASNPIWNAECNDFF